MSDPIRKPRKLRFRVSKALLVSAPLIGSIACGDDRPIAVNPAPEEPPAINVPVMREEPVMQPEPPPARTNLTVDQALGTEAIGMDGESTETVQAESMEAESMEAESMEGSVEPIRERTRMVNPRRRPPRPQPTTNPVPGELDL